MLRLAVAALIALSGSAFAMNWEGHDDDWTVTEPFGQAFEAAIPGAKPLPSKPCERRQPAKPGNAYEQIEIPSKHCPAGHKSAPERY